MREDLVRATVPAGTVVVGGLLAAIAAGMFFVGDFTLFVLALVVIQSIGVLSLNLLMGYAGQVSLGQAAFVGVGAFAAAELARAGVPFPVTIAGGAVAGALIAAIVGLPSLRIRGFQVAATTLAFGLVAERLLFVRPWDPAAGTGLAVARPAAIAGGRAFLLVALAGLAAVLLADRALRTSRFGRAMFAVRDREDTAAARGIHPGRVKLAAYALSGAIAGWGGGLFAYLIERASPESFTAFVSLGLVAAVVVGGLGSWSGAMVAGVAFAGLPELLRPIAGYAPLAGAALLLIVPAVRPEGLGWVLGRGVPLPWRARPIPDGTPIDQPVRPLALSMPVRTLLQATDVSVRFGGLAALDGVSLRVERGEIVGLIGPNGAGKSTFFNVLSGAVVPEMGRVLYRGRDLLAATPEERPKLGIGRTYQQVGLSPALTVLDNVLVAQHLDAGYGPLAALVRAGRARRIEDHLRERAVTALRIAGLEGTEQMPVGALPQGHRRAAELAAVLAAGPELILLDEPFAGTRPEDALALADRLRALRDELDLTIVIVEHDVPLVARMSEHVIVFDHGRVVAQGPPEAIRSDPHVIEIYLGTRAQQAVADA